MSDAERSMSPGLAQELRRPFLSQMDVAAARLWAERQADKPHAEAARAIAENAAHRLASQGNVSSLIETARDAVFGPVGPLAFEKVLRFK